MTATFRCQDGPYDGQIFKYSEPLPKVVVLADHRLHYHEYHRYYRYHGRYVYRWERSYRIPQPELQPADEEPAGIVLAW